MNNHSLLIDAETRDYETDDQGRPVIDKGLKTPAFVRLRTPRTRWMYAPNDRYGSDYYTVRKNLTTSDGSNLVNIGEQALAPLVEDQRAAQVDGSVVERTRHGALVKFALVDATGEAEETLIVPVGSNG